jgi:hypothetical protein
VEKQLKMLLVFWGRALRPERLQAVDKGIHRWMRRLRTAKKAWFFRGPPSGKEAMEGFFHSQLSSTLVRTDALLPP